MPLHLFIFGLLPTFPTVFLIRLATLNERGLIEKYPSKKWVRVAYQMLYIGLGLGVVYVIYREFSAIVLLPFVVYGMFIQGLIEIRSQVSYVKINLSHDRSVHRYAVGPRVRIVGALRILFSLGVLYLMYSGFELDSDQLLAWLGY